MELNTVGRLHVKESKQNVTGKAAIMQLWMFFFESFNFFSASAAVLQDSGLFMREQLALTLRWPCSSLVTACERSSTDVFAFAGLRGCLHSQHDYFHLFSN